MKKKKGKQGMMAIKIDVEKAYDRIEWDFLEAILCQVGFDAHLVQLIMRCTSQATLSVLENGVQLESFNPSGGIQQSDPLSPYLFVLCMEVLCSISILL